MRREEEAAKRETQCVESALEFGKINNNDVNQFKWKKKDKILLSSCFIFKAKKKRALKQSSGEQEHEKRKEENKGIYTCFYSKINPSILTNFKKKNQLVERLWLL